MSTKIPFPVRRRLSQRPESFTLDRNSPLANGLVFAGLAPGGLVGSTLYPDSSLYGNNGTLTNMDGSNWVFDPYLGRFVCTFDAVDEEIIVGSNGLSDSTQDFTASCWWKSGTCDTYACFITFNRRGIGARINGQVGVLYPGTSGNLKYMSGNPLVTDGTYYHLAATRTGSTYALYINGTERAMIGVNTGLELTNVYRIGRGFTTNYIGGSLADVMFWNRVLSSAEISQLADPSNTLLSGLILPPKRTYFPIASTQAPQPPSARKIVVPRQLFRNII